jgi:hypothetical protein
MLLFSCVYFDQLGHINEYFDNLICWCCVFPAGNFPDDVDPLEQWSSDSDSGSGFATTDGCTDIQSQENHNNTEVLHSYNSARLSFQGSPKPGTILNEIQKLLIYDKKQTLV